MGRCIFELTICRGPGGSSSGDVGMLITELRRKSEWQKSLTEVQSLFPLRKKVCAKEYKKLLTKKD